MCVTVIAVTEELRSDTYSADDLRRHWETLDLGDSATPADVNSAFRRLSKAAHPDAHGGSREGFDRLQEARRALLQVLGSTGQPRVYLRSMAAPGSPGGGARRPVSEQPVWLPGAFAALTVGSITGIVGVIQLDRRIILVGLLAATAVGVVSTVVLWLLKVHRANTAPDRIYRSADSVVKARRPRDRRSTG